DGKDPSAPGGDPEKRAAGSPRRPLAAAEAPPEAPAGCGEAPAGCGEAPAQRHAGAADDASAATLPDVALERRARRRPISSGGPLLLGRGGRPPGRPPATAQAMRRSGSSEAFARSAEFSLSGSFEQGVPASCIGCFAVVPCRPCSSSQQPRPAGAGWPPARKEGAPSYRRTTVSL
ncbi:unnamed protein product, partial [Prorocentrum cordatum]